MNFLDATATALYSRLTTSQMRDLLHAMVGSEGAAASSARSREDLTKRLDAFGDKSRLALMAHRVEALAAYKHCIPVLLTTPISFSSLRTKIELIYPRTIASFDSLSSTEDGLLAQICVFDEEGDRVFLKFAHQVDVWETVIVSQREKVNKLIKRRHIVVLTLRPLQKLITVTFPGFTHGQVGDERKTYLDIALEVLSLVRDRLGLEIETFNLKSAIDFILDDPSKGVIDLKRSALPLGGGKLTLDSQDSNQDAAAVLADSLHKEGGIDVTAAQVRVALRSMEAGDIALLWQKTGVITRISLRGAEPEILFVWSASDPSLALSENILKELILAMRGAPVAGVKDARDFIRTSDIGTVIRPSYIGQRFTLAPDTALNLLFSEAQRKNLAVRFRVKTERQLIGQLNPWVQTISEIPTLVRVENDEELLGHDPKNIEIAFERVLG